MYFPLDSIRLVYPVINYIINVYYPCECETFISLQKAHSVHIRGYICLSATFFPLTDNHYQQHIAFLSRNFSFLERNLHIIIHQTTIFNCWYIILIAILFHYSTVNFNLKPHDFSTVEQFRHILIILVFLSSPPWGWPREWQKHVGDHYAIKLHAWNQSPCVGILIYFICLVMGFIFVWLILDMPYVVRMFLLFLGLVLLVLLKWSISPRTDVRLPKNICLL